MSGSALEPPCWAVIFTSELGADTAGYDAMAARMVELASRRPGFLGVDSAREGIGITVSYWRDPASIAAWRADVEHQEAQRLGKERWYRRYRLRIARVERDWTFERPREA